MDEFQLRRLLLLVVVQQLLEDLTLLYDVTVLHLLLLVAVAADQLGPLLSVLGGDFLHLRGSAKNHFRSEIHSSRDVIKALS